jgi:hypothetical protein
VYSFFVGIRTGNVKLLDEAVVDSFPQLEGEEREKSIQQLVGHVFGDIRLTSLHLAAEGGHRYISMSKKKNTVYPRTGGKTYSVPQNRREKYSVAQNRRKKIQCTPRIGGKNTDTVYPTTYSVPQNRRGKYSVPQKGGKNTVYPRIGGEKYSVPQNRRIKYSVPQNRRKKIQCTGNPQ